MALYLHVIRHVGLYTDQYELTMIQAHYLKGRKDIQATFDYFFRKTPFASSYVIFAGLQDLLAMLEKFCYEEEDLDHLRSTGFHADFLDYLRNFHFAGTVYAPREGDVVFPNEPVVRVEGSIIEAQVVETLLLNIMNFQSLIATKASRLCRAAGERRTVIDFGLRRAQGLAGIHASKAAIIGGVQSTSNVYAALLFGIPATGTQAHAWIQSFDDEYESFEEFADTFPEKCILLVDTYDTLHSGVPNAIKVAKKMEQKGQKLFGIRLDSGDLVQLAKESRRMLDEAGLEYVKIVASSELDEHVIEEFLTHDAPIDGFGVGTNLVTGGKDAALDGVYKLCKSGGKPRLKLSENQAKIINPEQKNIIRYFREGEMYADGIFLETEDPAAITTLHDPIDSKEKAKVKGLENEILLKKVMAGGKSLIRQPKVQEIAEYVQERLQQLPHKYKVLQNGPEYVVGVSKELLDLRNKLIEKQSV